MKPEMGEVRRNVVHSGHSSQLIGTLSCQCVSSFKRVCCGHALLTGFRPDLTPFSGVNIVHPATIRLTESDSPNGIARRLETQELNHQCQYGVFNRAKSSRVRKTSVLPGSGFGCRKMRQ